MSLQTFGQTITGSFGSTSTATEIKGTLVVDNGLNIPTELSLNTAPTRPWAIRINTGTGYMEVWNGTSWSSPTGTGTVTAVSIVSANGFAGTSSGGATPAITLTTTVTGILKGNGTAISAAVAGTDYVASESDPTVSSIIKAIPVTTDATTNKYYYWNNGTIARKQILYTELSGAPTNVSSFTNDANYITTSGARSAISLTTTGSSGAATYNSSTGVLNIPNYSFSTPNLQSVLTAGNSANTGILLDGNTVSMSIQNTSVGVGLSKLGLDGTNSGVLVLRENNGNAGVYGQLNANGLTAQRTYSLPNASGTLALTSDIPSLTGYVPTSRTLTINGTAFDLSADRTWTISASLTSGQIGFGTSGVLSGSTDFTYDHANSTMTLAGTSGQPILILNSGSGGTGVLKFQESGVNNWIIGKASPANFNFNRYNSSGVFQATDLQIEYSTGNLLVNSLKSGSTAPTTTGTTVMVVSDQNGRLSFQTIPSGGSGANALGTYIVQTSTNAPTNAQVLASLSTGLLKVTTSTGVLSTAVAADVPDLSSLYVALTGAQNVGGSKTFTSAVNLQQPLNWRSGTSTVNQLGDRTDLTNHWGVVQLGSDANSNFGQLTINTLTGTRIWTLPDATGTIALTGDLSSYLTTSSAASTYQPLDGDLTSLASASGTNTIYYRSAANTWSAITIGSNLTFSSGTLSAASSGANALGTYIVQTATNAPANAQVLASLSTGILKSTTTTGVLSIAAAGTDYQAPITLTTTGTSGAATFSSNTLNIPNYGSAIPTAANPTGTIGLSAVNGSATTYMRSDAAPVLSQSIVPTWTGVHTFQQSNITTTSTDAVVILNNTAATSGVTQQYSPRLRFTGSAWKSNATATAQTDDYWIEGRALTGATATTINLAFVSRIAGGSTTDAFVITSAGAGTFASSITASSIIKSGGTSSQFLMADGSVNSSTFLTANQTITLSGDISGSGTTAITTTIGSNKVTTSMLTQLAAHSYLGNNTGSTANATAVTSTQLTADLNLFSSTLQGLVPASGGGTTNFLRADGTWAAPSGSGGGSMATLSDVTLTSLANGDRLKYNGTVWINQTAASLKSDLALNNVENTALSTWSGSTAITTLGTITTGTWNGSVISSTYLPTTTVYKDANSNISANNFLEGYTTTATAGTTTTLTVASTEQQFFTGSTTQTITLPVASTMTLGQKFRIHNLSTGALTVNSSGGNTVIVIGAGGDATITNILTSGTTAASWHQDYDGMVIASGKILTVSNTLTFTGTDGSSIAFGAGGTVLYNGGALGTPSSATLTNATGLPVSTGISGLGTGIATWLATPNSSNLISAMTDETGTGALVFGTAPTFTTSITMADAANIIVGTTTGTKIGTATTQKLGFYNSTPIVQPSGAILTALSNLGLITSPTLAASDISSGTFAAARLASSGTADNTTYLGGDQTWHPATQTRAITMSSPTNSENAMLFFTPIAITVTNVQEALAGSSPSVTYVLNYGSSRSSATSTIVASHAATSTTGTSATLNVTSIPANSYIWLTTSATSGTVNDFNVTINFRQ